MYASFALFFLYISFQLGLVLYRYVASFYFILCVYVFKWVFSFKLLLSFEMDFNDSMIGIYFMIQCWRHTTKLLILVFIRSFCSIFFFLVVVFFLIKALDSFQFSRKVCVSMCSSNQINENVIEFRIRWFQKLNILFVFFFLFPLNFTQFQMEKFSLNPHLNWVSDSSIDYSLNL